MTWLVTGGAGYIGSHVVQALVDAGLGAVVIDDLSSGREQFVPERVPFVRGDILDGEALRSTIDAHGVSGVIHVAGYKYAGVSVQRPLHTYEQNVTGTAVLLAAMQDRGVDRIVFSSSAAVYGTPDTDLVTEDTLKDPQSPYGESKLIGEWLLRDQGVATGLRHTSLRYFNVVGSGASGVFDVSPHNLFPLVFDALLAGRIPRVFGDDYPTPDGTNVRDYIHVSDLAVSHGRGPAAGCGRTGRAGLQPRQRRRGVGRRDHVDDRGCHRHRLHPRDRAAPSGDPARIVAGGALAARDLDWRMRHTLRDMVASAWAARSTAG